jgi:transcription initiation factor TFIIIB Brf1 subunit/transcription initiation factor TFIIB
MENFKLFEELLEPEIINKPITKCDHINIIEKKNTKLCEDCGEEINAFISHDKEWRYYGKFDSKNSDPNRVQSRRMDDKNIYKDVENMGFSDKIVNIANDLYHQVTKGKIKRGNSRKAIIFACIFQSFKLYGTPQTHEYLIKTFNLNRKSGLQGLKHVSLNAPKTSNIHTTHITPIHLVKDIMEKFCATEKHINEVIKIYNEIKNKDATLNRCRPLSYAAGVVFFWIQINNKDVSIKEFIKKIPLSELTVMRIVKIINDIIKV